MVKEVEVKEVEADGEEADLGLEVVEEGAVTGAEEADVGLEVVEEGAVTEAEEKVEMVEMVEAAAKVVEAQSTSASFRDHCNRCRRGRPEYRIRMGNGTQ